MKMLFRSLFKQIVCDKVLHFSYVPDGVRAWLETYKESGKLIDTQPPRLCATRTFYFVGEPQFTLHDVCIQFKLVKQDSVFVSPEGLTFEPLLYLCPLELDARDVLFYFEREKLDLDPIQCEYFTVDPVYPSEVEVVYYLTEEGYAWARQVARICKAALEPYPSLNKNLLELTAAVMIAWFSWMFDIKNTDFPVACFQLYWDIAEALPDDWRVKKCKQRTLEVLLEYDWPEDVPTPSKLPVSKWHRPLIVNEETIRKVTSRWKLDEEKIKHFIDTIFARYFNGGVIYTKNLRETNRVLSELEKQEEELGYTW